MITSVWEDVVSGLKREIMIDPLNRTIIKFPVDFPA